MMISIAIERNDDADDADDEVEENEKSCEQLGKLKFAITYYKLY